MANIAVLDFEAQSASTSTGKIISVSGILYNDQFQELDRFELFCTIFQQSYSQGDDS